MPCLDILAPDASMVRNKARPKALSVELSFINRSDRNLCRTISTSQQTCFTVISLILEAPHNRVFICLTGKTHSSINCDNTEFKQLAIDLEGMKVLFYFHIYSTSD